MKKTKTQVLHEGHKFYKPIQLTKVILDILSSHDAHPYEIYREYRRRLKDAEKINKRKYNKGSYQNTWHNGKFKKVKNENGGVVTGL